MHGNLPDIEDESEYNRIMAEARSRFEVPDQPAMPVIPYSLNGPGRPGAKAVPATRAHQDRVAPSYLISPEALNLVHLSVDMKKAMKIPAAN